jgi:hypothetical protein
MTLSPEIRNQGRFARFFLTAFAEGYITKARKAQIFDMRTVSAAA